MDKHFLTPLFAPTSIAAFVGEPSDPGGQTALGRTLREAFRADRFDGTLRFIDIRTQGTLEELAQTHADLALIALAPRDVAAALEIAGRIGCKAAVVISTGIAADQAAQWRK